MFFSSDNKVVNKANINRMAKIKGRRDGKAEKPAESWGKDSVPFILTECKEMNVPLSTSVLQQVLNYNMGIQAQYVIVTNGNQSFAFEKSNHSFVEVHELARFS